MPNRTVDLYSDLQESERALRDVIESELLDGAAESLARYRRSFDALWSTLTEEERRRSDLPEQALALMHWAQSVVTLIRSTALERSRALKGAGAYRKGRKAPSWQVAG